MAANPIPYWSRCCRTTTNGDFMIEIDEPSVDSRFESHRISYEWARHNLPVNS
jgi:hypothetical protein